MDKVYILEELKQVTEFLADMPLSNSPHHVISDTLSYAVYLINQLQEDPLYATFAERLDNCITQLNEIPEQNAAVASVLPASIKILRHYTRSVSKKLHTKEPFLRKFGFWF
ncbi:hypothetical protein [Lacibacter sediminis]|uniref:Uncharacterized protein n=1 Tax=Lacibacter sediminis TaxID=2760713 RepID=A0A7G5XCD7_9BACT|nr:hypothetical protein [Lacibacter sediminis]QNA43140.1 hypothetical protein H4075_13730 [Lacibacter sediminis]